MDRPLERNYFILDSKRATLSVFKSLKQEKADDLIVVAQCLMSFQTDYSIVNKDLSKKFEVQPLNDEFMPVGDLLQLSVPNQTSQEDFQLLVQAFMRASRVQHAPKESYWASNVIYGFGLGTKSLAEGVALGSGGVVYEPYRNVSDHGIGGLPGGVAKGIGGLVGRPVKGAFDFVA